MKKKKRIGTVAFLILAVLSLTAGFFPTAHPVAATPFDTGTLAWMLTASGLVLLMTPGLSFFYGGMVNPKSIISTMLQSFIALGVVSVLWFVVAFSLAFGDSIGGLIGNPMSFFMLNHVGTAPHPRIGSSIPFILFAAFQLKFAIITPALITGSFAERVRFWAYVLFMALFTVFIYAPLAHWTWHPDGFLFKWGVLDFAGGTVVHISAGSAALAGSLYLGRRKAHLEGASHSPVNIPYVLLGTGMLWFGWFGFNAGSALAINALAVDAFVNTNLASAAAMLSWILWDATQGKRPSALGAAVGAVVGLVAITPAAGFVNYGQSVFIGFAAAVISNLAVGRKNRSALDDTLDVFPCHGVGGIVGMIFTGIFANTAVNSALTEQGLAYGETSLFVKHLGALALVLVFTFGGSWLLYWLTDRIIPLRVTEDQEEAGLDLSQHDESVFAISE